MLHAFLLGFFCHFLSVFAGCRHLMFLLLSFGLSLDGQILEPRQEILNCTVFLSFFKDKIELKLPNNSIFLIIHFHTSVA